MGDSNLTEAMVPQDLKNFKMIMQPFFARYDSSEDGKLDLNEFKFCLKELGIPLTGEILTDASSKRDPVSFEEFVQFVFKALKYILEEPPPCNPSDKKCTLPNY